MLQKEKVLQKNTNELNNLRVGKTSKDKSECYLKYLKHLITIEGELEAMGRIQYDIHTRRH